MTQQVSTAFYDLEDGPVSYDFITWLVRARKRAGADALHVVVVPKEDGLGGFARHWGPHDAEAARWRLQHIVLAACPLAQASCTFAATRAQAQLLKRAPYWWPKGKAHMLGPLVHGAKNGEKVPMLCATDYARHTVERWSSDWSRTVTITLRANADDGRDSQKENWALAEDWLDEQGWNVITLDDTREALVAAIGSYAEVDLDLRCALYQRAAMNLFVNNGPQVLAWHSGAPFLAFCAAMPEDKWRWHWAEYLGLNWGDQLPWATKHQRLVYRADTFEAIKEEFQKWAGATS